MADVPRRRRRGVVACAVIGLLLLQAAWILTLPPFRGSDEHDHAFKAAAVARGDLSSTHVASPQGRGQFMTVPRDLVEAALPVCENLSYTTPDNCAGRPSSEPGTVRVASNAAPYNPVYYVLPGLAGRPFTGATSLYVMRIVSALMCTALLGLALIAQRRWAISAWPGIALLAVLTPTFVYTTAMAAPNGLEMAAAVLVWLALLGIVRQPEDERPDRLLVGLGTVGAVLLTTVRGLGPAWLLLVVLAVVVVDPRRGLRVLGDRRTLVAAAASALATAYAAWWVLSSQIVTGATPSVLFKDNPWPKLPQEWVLWFLQSVAAIPLRDYPAPGLVYAVGLVFWLVLVGLALRFVSRQQRLAMAFVALATTAVAIGVSLHTYAHLGTSWQGRYGYPFSLGVLLVAGLALDARTTGRLRDSRWPVVLAGGCVFVMMIVSQVRVLARELRDSPLAHSAEWVRPSVALLVVLDLAGTALLAWALSDSPDPQRLTSSGDLGR